MQSNFVNVLVFGHGQQAEVRFLPWSVSGTDEFMFSTKSDRVFVVDMRSGSCPDGRVDLVLDVDGASMEYDGYTFRATSDMDLEDPFALDGLFDENDDPYIRLMNLEYEALERERDEACALAMAEEPVF